MASTYTPIATTTLGSASATVDFTSISSAYTDLLIVVNWGQSSDVEGALFRVGNGSFDTGSNYSYTSLYGDGSSAGSIRGTNTTNCRFASSSVGGPSSTITANAVIHIQNYANTSTYKTSIVRSNIPSSTYPATSATVNLWRSTSAINQIRFYLTGGNYTTGSTFTLYGIASA